VKINIEVDCTPEEARRTVGLPDLTPVHEVFVGRLQELVAQATDPSEAQNLIRNWMSAGLQGFGAVQRAVWDAARGATQAPGSDRNG
jgi:hypothetical protein